MTSSAVLKLPNGDKLLPTIGGGLEIHVKHGSYTIPTVVMDRGIGDAIDPSSLTTYLSRPKVKEVNRKQHQKYLMERMPFTVGHDFISDRLMYHVGENDRNEMHGWMVPSIMNAANDGRSPAVRQTSSFVSPLDYYGIYPIELDYSEAAPGNILQQCPSPSIAVPVGYAERLTLVWYKTNATKVCAQTGASPILNGLVKPNPSLTETVIIDYINANWPSLQGYANNAAQSFMRDLEVDPSVTEIIWLKTLCPTNDGTQLMAKSLIGSSFTLADIMQGKTNVTLWLVGDANYEEMHNSLAWEGKYACVGISRYIGVPIVNIASTLITGSTSRITQPIIRLDPNKKTVSAPGLTGRGELKSLSLMAGSVDAGATPTFSGTAVKDVAWLNANSTSLLALHPDLPRVIGHIINGTGIGRTGLAREHSWRSYRTTKSACLPLGLVERRVVMDTDWLLHDDNSVLFGTAKTVEVAVYGEAIVERMRTLYAQRADAKLDQAYADLEAKAVQLNGRFVRTRIFDARVNQPGSVLETRLARDYDKGKKSSDVAFGDQVISEGKTLKQVDAKRPASVGGFTMVTNFVGEYERVFSEAALGLQANPGSVKLYQPRGSNEVKLTTNVTGVTSEDIQLLFLKNFPLGDNGDPVANMSVAELTTRRTDSQQEFSTDQPVVTKYGLQPYDLGAVTFPPVMSEDEDVAKRQYFVFATNTWELTNTVILMTIQDKTLQVS